MRSSCSSPHRPRTCGARSAFTSCFASVCMALTCSRSPAYALARSFSTVRSCPSTRCRVAETGSSNALMACARAVWSPSAFAASPAVASLIRPSASRTKASLFRASASADSAWKTSRSSASRRVSSRSRSAAVSFSTCSATWAASRSERREAFSAAASAAAVLARSASCATWCSRSPSRSRSASSSARTAAAWARAVAAASACALAVSAPDARSRPAASTQPSAPPAARPTNSTVSPARRSTAPRMHGSPDRTGIRRAGLVAVDTHGRVSCASNQRFTCSPQRNPPSVPSLRSTRWHGTKSAAALRAQAEAAARTAAGRPAFAANSV